MTSPAFRQIPPPVKHPSKDCLRSATPARQGGSGGQKGRPRKTGQRDSRFHLGVLYPYSIHLIVHKVWPLTQTLFFLPFLGEASISGVFWTFSRSLNSLELALP